MSTRKPAQPKTHTGASHENLVSPPEEASLTALQETGEPAHNAAAQQRPAVTTEAPVPELSSVQAQPAESVAAAEEVTSRVDNKQPGAGMDSTQRATNEPNTAAPETGLVTRFPALHLSLSELTFAKTSVGKPIFMVFTIAQQNADTPVTITSDEPTHFQVASDSRPAFKPVLTLSPSPTGTFVHVRFAPIKAGQINGHLIIETPYTTKFLSITGRGTGLLSAVRTAPVVHQPQRRPSARSRSLMGGLALTTLLVAGLATAGYTFRCQLLPSLCDEVTNSSAGPSQPINAPATAPVAESTNDMTLTGQRMTAPVAAAKSSDGERRRRKPEITAGPTVDRKMVDQKMDPVTRDEPVREVPGRKQSAAKGEESVGLSAASDGPVAPLSQKAKAKPADAPQPKVVRPEKPLEPATAPAGESDLERELNTKKPKNQ